MRAYGPGSSRHAGECTMGHAKLFGLVLAAALGPWTGADAQERQALLLQAGTPRIQNFTPVQSVFACHWDCFGIKAEIFCPSGSHCSAPVPRGREYRPCARASCRRRSDLRAPWGSDGSRTSQVAPLPKERFLRIRAYRVRVETRRALAR